MHNVKNTAIDAVNELKARLPEPHRFERLVHAMLHHQRVNITLHSRDGGTYWPREWFNVELDTARQVVTRIVDRSIARCRMDNTIGWLIWEESGE